MVLFYQIFSESDHLKMNHVFFKYAKFLLQVPPRTCNMYFMKKYNFPDLCGKPCELQAQLSNKQIDHEWQHVIFNVYN